MFARTDDRLSKSFTIHSIYCAKRNEMKFIEMTGATLETIITDGELHNKTLDDAGVSGTSIVRVNQHGDIEVRRAHKWDVIGGLLGNFEERIKQTTGCDWA